MSSTHSKPFFVVGSQRSGTTMLRLMLNQHPNIAIPHESGFITVFYPKLAGYGNLAFRQNQEKLLDDICEYHLVKRGQHVPDRAAVLAHPIADFADLIDAIFSEYARSRGKARWGDKTPYYTTDMDVLWRLFPGCRFIHVIRDGRDVALSLRKLEWGSKSIPRLAADWRWKTVLAHKIGAVLGEHYLEIHYEDLVMDPEGKLREVCRFLGEAYSPAMLEYPSTSERIVPRESLKWHRQSVRAPDPTKISEWKYKMSRSDAIIFEQIAGSALEQFGYETLKIPTSLGSKLMNLYYCLIRRW